MNKVKKRPKQLLSLTHKYQTSNAGENWLRKRKEKKKKSVFFVIEC